MSLPLCTNRLFTNSFHSLVVVIVLFAAATSGCSSWKSSHTAAVNLFAQGQLEDSRARLSESLAHRNAEQDLLLLEQSMLDLAAGDPQTAERQLRSSRRVLEHLQQADIREKASAVVTDDRAVAWSARPFERQMLLNMLTISSLLNGGEDAFAYTQQLAQIEPAAAQEDTADPDKSRLDVVTVSGSTAAQDSQTKTTDAGLFAGRDQALAFSAWIRALVTSESAMRWQECERALTDLAEHAADPAVVESLAQCCGVRCPRGQGGLHIVFLLGQSPEWIPERAEPTSTALLLADRILSATGEHSLPPTVAAVRIAKPNPTPVHPVASSLVCSVATGHGDALQLSRLPLVDLNRAAQQEYQATRDAAVARAVVRRVTKKGAVVAAKEVSHLQRNSLADLAINLGGIAWEALEKPDLRSWRTLPARIDTASTTLPEGDWSLQIGSPGEAVQTIPVHVANGRNTLVVCLVPADKLVGHVLVGGADSGSHPLDRHAVAARAPDAAVSQEQRDNTGRAAIR
jgi:hypothetical protein